MPSPLVVRIPLPQRARRVLGVPLLAFSLLGASSAQAGVWQAGGSLVDVSIEVEGGAAPLYPARDGSGRYYLEARAGCAYAVRLANRSGQRIGVLLAVDGLNAISGEREAGPSAPSRPGRMYVVDPWDDLRVQGWRTSLEDVRRFTFVDERSSYSARTGRANGKMGWIEAWIYRERRPAAVLRSWPGPWDRGSYPEEAPDERRHRDAPPPDAADSAAGREGAPPAAPAPPASAPPADAAPAPKARSAEGGLKRSRPETAEGFPGTGWGSRAWDPAMVVDFVPEARPSDRVIVRYEYAPALRALGLLTPRWDGDRLRERERGSGFARPPAW
jgi:hypothetical protein